MRQHGLGQLLELGFALARQVFAQRGGQGRRPIRLASLGGARRQRRRRRALGGVHRHGEQPQALDLQERRRAVGALEDTGAIAEVANAIKDITQGDRSAELLGILWISGIGSGVVGAGPAQKVDVRLPSTLIAMDDN